MKIRRAIFQLFGAALLGIGAASNSVAGDDPQGTSPAVSKSQPNLLAALNDKGVTFPFIYIGEVMGNLSGGYRQGAVYDGLVKAGVQFDLEKFAGWKGASVLVSAMYPHGGSLTNFYVHDFNVVSNIDAYNSVRLYEVWFQQNFDGDRFSIRIGQIASDAEFCVCNSGCLFINSAFGVVPVLSKNLSPPTYPVPAPGVRVRFAPNDSFYAQFGAFIGNAGDPATNNRYGTRFFEGSTGALLMGEIGYTLNPPPKPDESKKQVVADRPLSGTYKLDGFYDTEIFDNLVNGRQQRGEYGFYLIADQEVWHEPGDPDQGLRLFGRIGAAPADHSIVSFYCESGLNYQGLLPSRDKDIFGVGLSYTKISGDLLVYNGAPVESHYETIIEVSYLAQINAWLSVQPDFQYVFNPGATGTQQNAVVAGLRFTVNF